MKTADDATHKLTPKGRATRERIVAVAAALTYERGVAGTSTEGVREAAGVSASRLYHYFDSKQALLRAVIARRADAVLAAQQPHLGQSDSLDAPRAWRDHVVARRRRRDHQGGCPLGTLSCELAGTWPEARADLLGGFGRWEGGLRRGLRAMRDRGGLRADADPDRLALALLASVHGGLLLNQVRQDTAALEAALDTTLAQIASLVP